MPIPNLKDNIKDINFKIESFIDIDEGKEFINKAKKKFEDIVFNLSDIISTIGDVANKITAMVKNLLEQLNLRKLFDKLGLKELFGFIFDYVGDNLEGFGFSANTREQLRTANVNSCMSFNGYLSSEFNITLPNIESLTIIGVLTSMSCNGVTGVYTSLYDTLKGNLVSNINGSVEDVTVETAKIDDKLSSMFAGSVSHMLKIPNPNAISILEDISNSPFAGKARIATPNVTTLALKYIDSDTSNTSNFEQIDTIFKGYNPVFGLNTDVTPFKTAGKFKSLAIKHNLGRKPATEGTLNALPLSVLSLVV